MKSFLHEILYLIAGLIILNLIVSGVHGLVELPTDALLHIGVTLIGVVMALLGRLFFLRREVAALVQHYQRIDPKVRRTVLSFLLPNLKMHLENGRILSGDGLSVNEDELERLVEISFQNCNKSYQGTDRNPPSIFNRFYPTYIKRQVDRQARRMNYDTRFLTVSRSDLNDDYKNNRTEFEKFYDNHINTGIELLQVDLNIADAYATQYRLPSTDVGVFGWKWVIFYSLPTNGNAGPYRVQILPLARYLSKRVALYLMDLNKNAMKIQIQNGAISFIRRTKSETHDQRMRMFQGKVWPPGLRSTERKGMEQR